MWPPVARINPFWTAVNSNLRSNRKINVSFHCCKHSSIHTHAPANTIYLHSPSQFVAFTRFTFLFTCEDTARVPKLFTGLYGICDFHTVESFVSHSAFVQHTEEMLVSYAMRYKRAPGHPTSRIFIFDF